MRVPTGLEIWEMLGGKLRWDEFKSEAAPRKRQNY